MIRRIVSLGMVALAGALVSQVGCSTYGDDESGEDEGEVGVAQIAISEVPLDGSVGCVAVTATGSFTVTQSEDVSPGESTVLEMNHLPVGTVSFLGNAYPGPCAAVTPATPPTWISDPVLATVSHVQPVQVQLVMKKNGKADVDVDFDDDPACSADGAPCLVGAECCSQSCVAGACQSGPPACGTGLTSCGNVCVDLMTDTSNCGACGSTCVPGSTCNAGVCLVPSCADSIKNGTETDVDCGGVCPPCQTGDSCVVGSDCQVGLCINGACAECASSLDCPAAINECQPNACAAGTCMLVNAPFGTLVSTQTVGDCNTVVCDGTGLGILIIDNADVPNDGNDCTVDVCVAGVALFTPASAGTSCSQNGGVICDGAGNCI